MLSCTGSVSSSANGRLHTTLELNALECSQSWMNLLLSRSPSCTGALCSAHSNATACWPLRDHLQITCSVGSERKHDQHTSVLPHRTMHKRKCARTKLEKFAFKTTLIIMLSLYVQTVALLTKIHACLLLAVNSKFVKLPSFWAASGVKLIRSCQWQHHLRKKLNRILHLMAFRAQRHQKTTKCHRKLSPCDLQSTAILSSISLQDRSK